LDDRNQIRISLEAEAILGVLAFCESGKIKLILSDALLFEVQKIPKLTRKEYALGVLSKTKEFIQLNPEIEDRAMHFNKRGIKPLDALHLACAENAKVDFCVLVMINF